LNKHKNAILQTVAELIAENKIVKIRLGGTSMFPFLRDGDVAYIQKVEIEKLKRGDVIVFLSNYKFIAHRIVKKITRNNETCLLCKGDARSKFDPIITPDKYLGRIDVIERHKKIIRFDAKHIKIANLFLSNLSLYAFPLFKLITRIAYLFS